MERKLLAELNALVERAQRVLTEYLPPESGISPEEAITSLLEVLDGPNQRRIQDEVSKVLGERPALFGD